MNARVARAKACYNDVSLGNSGLVNGTGTIEDGLRDGIACEVFLSLSKSEAGGGGREAGMQAGKEGGAVRDREGDGDGQIHPHKLSWTSH